MPFELPKRLFIPNIEAFNSIIKGSFPGGDNQDINLPEIALGVACKATLVDQDDSSEIDEDNEGVDNDLEVIADSPEGDKSDVNEKVSFLEDEEDLSSHKLEIIGGFKEGSEWLVLDDVYILHSTEQQRRKYFGNVPAEERLTALLKLLLVRMMRTDKARANYAEIQE